jgi:hypothetical protein
MWPKRKNYLFYVVALENRRSKIETPVINVVVVVLVGIIAVIIIVAVHTLSS